MTVELPRIGPQNVDIYREVRLRALRESPTAFGSNWERESAFSDAEWAERAGRLDGDTAVGYLAQEGEATVGLIGCYLNRVDPSVATIVSMWVAPDHRRTGVGRALVDAVVEWARERRVRAIRLMVTSNNDGARRFYLEMGFALTGSTEPFANDPMLEEWEMSRGL